MSPLSASSSEFGIRTSLPPIHSSTIQSLFPASCLHVPSCGSISSALQTPSEQSLASLASPRAWYRAPVSDFLRSGADTIVGQLVRNSAFALLPTQRDAWLMQIGFLQERLIGLNGSVFLEFNIPRMGR